MTATESNPEIRKPSLLRRIGLDTRPLGVVPFRRMLIGQSAASWVDADPDRGVRADVPDHRLVVLRRPGGPGRLVPVVMFGLYGGAIADAWTGAGCTSPRPP